MANDDTFKASRSQVTKFIVALACAFGVLLLAFYVVLPAVRQARAVRLLQADRAYVAYDGPSGSPGCYDKLASLAPKSWTDLFYNVKDVGLNRQGPLPAGYLRLFESLPRLNSADLNVGRLSADDVEILARVPLVSLQLGDPIDDDAVVGFALLNHLQHLVLNDSRLSDAGLARLPLQLTEMKIIGGRFDNRWFGQFQQLQGLWLEGCQLGQGALEEIAKIDSLVWVRLVRTDVNSISGLKGMKNLKSLFLYGSRVDDDGLKDIGGLESLQILALNGNPITDAGLKHLAALTHLSELDLTLTHVTDAGMLPLMGLPELRHVSAEGTRLGWTAIDAVLKRNRK